MATRRDEVISGAFTGERIAAVNPRSGAVDYTFAAPSPTELSGLVAKLRAAQPTWAGASMQTRVDVLRRWRVELVARQAEIVQALSQDTGRYAICLSEFQAVLGYIDRWTRQAPELAQEQEGQSAVVPTLSYRSQYVPYALVGVISPWNFPLTLALIDAIPALLAGCAVIVKPSEVTPRFAAPLARSVAAVPELAAVLTIAPGGRAMGESLVSSAVWLPRTRRVTSFLHSSSSAARIL
jgi:succinate-semialdehyde dehydrogenase / glutarate-semialdehyde dehydrogenase